MSLLGAFVFCRCLQVTLFSLFQMNETYKLLGVDVKDVVTLEKYLQDYFTNILKKLKDLKARSIFKQQFSVFKHMYQTGS